MVVNNGTDVTYTPNPDFNGIDAFTYVVCDDGLDDTTPAPRCSAVVAIVDVTVTTVNDVPDAVGDSATVAEDDVYDSGTDSVLDNDSDHPLVVGENNVPLTAVLGTTTTNGTLDLHADGTFTYTPDADFNGSDSFTYRAKDSLDGLSAPATVSITVTEVNDAPIADTDSTTTAEDTAKDLIDVLERRCRRPVEREHPDADGHHRHGAVHGSASVNLDGTIKYTPAADFNGADSLIYQVCDNGTTDGVADILCDTATLSITVTSVNDVPVVAGDSATVTEDGSFDSGTDSVLDNDSDSHGGAPDEDNIASDRGGGHGRAARDPGPRLGRHVHLRPGCRLQRHRLVHLHGDGRQGRRERRGHGHDHGHVGQRRRRSWRTTRRASPRTATLRRAPRSSPTTPTCTAARRARTTSR